MEEKEQCKAERNCSTDSIDVSLELDALEISSGDPSNVSAVTGPSQLDETSLSAAKDEKTMLEGPTTLELEGPTTLELEG